MNFTPAEVYAWAPRLFCGVPFLMAVYFLARYARYAGRRFGSLL